jgi:anion-transporting  ArsA/GET3 family ATPase
MTAGLGLVTGALNKILGAQMLRDVQAFVAALDTLFGGFRQRAQRTYQLLQAEGTAFLVVAAPEPDALREAAYFVERLNEEKMPLAGLVVNRTSALPRGRMSADQAMAAAERLDDEQGDDASREGSATAGLLRLHADRLKIVDRETRLRQRFSTAHPDVPSTVVTALSTDVHDLDGLRRVGELLARTS